jgi:transcriptional regulator with XRE-family HTH domain
MTINPETLQSLRAYRGISQQVLADLSGVEKKTIARIETSKTNPSKTTIKKLAIALTTEPELLAGPVSKIIDAEKDKKATSCGNSSVNNAQTAFRKISETVSSQTHLSYQMVEFLYGISSRVQSEMAPLFMALFVEASLKWRRKKLRKIDKSALKIRNLAEGHLSFALAINDIEEGADVERKSILERDIFGKQLIETADRFCFDSDTSNPLADYIRNFAKELNSKYIEIDPDDWKWIGSSGMPDYRIGDKVVELISGADGKAPEEEARWASYALNYGRVNILDIPKDLMTREKAVERVVWIAAQISPEDRMRIDQEHADLLADF